MGDKRNPEINRIWKVLKIFENMQDDNHTADINDLHTYLERLCVKLLGENDNDIYSLMKGLCRTIEIEHDVTHKIVRGIVFDAIEIIEDRERRD